MLLDSESGCRSGLKAVCSCGVESAEMFLYANVTKQLGRVVSLRKQGTKGSGQVGGRQEPDEEDKEDCEPRSPENHGKTEDWKV